MGLVSTTELRAASLDGLTVAVLGYGSQGRAQALNLRDSGVPVVVGLRRGSPHLEQATADGLQVLEPVAAVQGADLVAMLVPDEAQPGLYAHVVLPHLRQGGGLVFAHGFNIHYGHIRPRADLDVMLVAPSGIGEQVRELYQQGYGAAAFVAVGSDASGQARSHALAYARALGAGRVAVIETTFAEEVETDLFVEQAVLVGGLTALIRAGFDTLVEAGYQPEIAYFSCLEEVKLMADMIYRQGLASLWRSISSTAAFGGLEVGSTVIGDSAREAMRAALDRIRSGEFAHALEAETAAGSPRLESALEQAEKHPIEAVRAHLRELARTSGVGPRGE